MHSYDEPPVYIPGQAPRPRDPKTDEARLALLKLFADHPSRVFFARQLELLLEKDFFHWITSRALSELIAEGKIGSEKVTLRTGVTVKFCMAKANRYWRREARKVGDLIIHYSDPAFTKALGQQGELLFDAALPTVGFMPQGKDVKDYNGKRWEKTGHDLDRVFEYDAVGYGTEIKNTLDYIPADELDAKIEMCAFLGLKPLFIMRYAPKNYMKKIIDAGGIGLLFEYQLYPYGYEVLAKQVQQELGLKVDCPTRVAEGTLERLVKAHAWQKARAGKV
jgi:hypothetical protein